MDNVASVALEPCGHVLTCNKCTLPSLICTGLRCSICRELVLKVPMGSDPKDATSFVEITTSSAMPHVGVTLKNSKKGVVVVGLAKEDAGIRHLRKGDQIKSINGIPAVHHRTMVTLIDACSQSNTSIHIVLSSGKHKVSSYLRQLAENFYRANASH